MTWVMREFAAADIAATKKAWNQDLVAATDVFPGDFTRALQAAEACDYASEAEPSYSYGVFEDGSHVAAAIVNVIVAKTGKKWVKMLDCVLRPKIAEGQFKNDPQSVADVVNIYAASVVGVFGIGKHHKAAAVKVYGRSTPLLSVLTQLGTVINERAEKINVAAKIESRWLVLTKKREKT